VSCLICGSCKEYCRFTHILASRSRDTNGLILMAKKSKKRRSRRPQQLRARQTVDAVLDGVIRVLKREGFDALNTNRIAEVAGVSIGSVYQYFPDKKAIFAALHQRHIEQIDRLIERQLVEHAASSLDDLVRALVEAMVDAHTVDPELFELLLTEVPHRADGTRDFASRLHGVFLLAISARAHEMRKHRELDKVVFVVTNMVESLSHAAALRRPPGLSLTDAKEEAVRAVLTYLHA
jgi:AcrR family transcriptional regulator